MVTDVGFDTVLRDTHASINEITAKQLERRAQRQQRLRWATYTLILAWVLTALALAGHLLHQCASHMLSHTVHPVHPGTVEAVYLNTTL
jgi:hypothetical protein